MKFIKFLERTILTIAGCLIMLPLPIQASSVWSNFRNKVDTNIKQTVTYQHDKAELGNDEHAKSVNQDAETNVQVTLNADVNDILAGQPQPTQPVKGQTMYMIAFDNHQDAVNGLNQIKNAANQNQTLDMTTLKGVKSIKQYNQLVAGRKTVNISDQTMDMSGLVISFKNLSTINLSL